MRLRYILLLASLAGALNSSMAAEKLIPIDTFIHEDEFSHPRLSPDGKYLAITRRLPDKDRFIPTVMVYSLPEMKEQSAVRMPAFQVPLGYMWVTNTRLLVSKGKEIGSREAPIPTGEVFAMDFDGTKQEYIFGYNMGKSKHGNRFGDNYGHGYVNSIPLNRNGRFFLNAHMWESDHSMLYDVDANNATRKLLASINSPDLSYLIQRDGTPRFAFGGDQNNRSILFRRDDNKDEWTRVSNDKVGHNFEPLAFSADDTEFLATSSASGEPEILVRENTKTGTRVTVLEDKYGSVDSFMSGANQDLPFAARTSIGIPKVHYLDENTAEAKLHKMLSAKFAGNHVVFVNYTDDGSKLLFGVVSDREPGSYFLFDRKTNKAYPLFASKQLIDPDQMAERRPIRFKARDGLELDGFLTVPKQVGQKKMPMVLLPHGGPHGPHDEWFFDTDAQFLASRGYAVLQVNFRGSGGRGLNFQQSGYRQWGAKIQDDLIDGVKWAIDQANVDANRICSYGISFGGYSALMITTRAPELFKCAIGYAGVYDLNLLFEGDEAKEKRFFNAMVTYVGQDKDELDRFSPAKLAEQIKVPVMLVHGEEDKRALFSHALAMRAALVKVNRPPEWMAVPDEGHGFYNTKNITEFYTRMEAFLAKNIGPK